jgi:hypothetical protein
MGRPLTMTRTENTSEDIRGAASKSRDAGQFRRLLALAFVLDGQPRTETARKTGVDRQTPRGLRGDQGRRKGNGETGGLI